MKKHVWFDEYVNKVTINKDGLTTLHIDPYTMGGTDIQLSRTDIIALAQRVELTPEELIKKKNAK